jgi:sialate O-acetylesterase
LIVEARYKALVLIPHSGIATTTDIGHRTCIHPPQKPLVGERLAMHVLSKDYGFKSPVADAPRYESMRRDGKKLVLTFGNLKPSGNNGENSFAYFDGKGTMQLSGFEIAGEDRAFHHANAGFK